MTAYVSHVTAAALGDEVLVLCPKCGVRVAHVDGYAVMQDEPDGMLLRPRQVPRSQRMLLKPCGHVVEQATWRQLGDVLDVTSREKPQGKIAATSDHLT